MPGKTRYAPLLTFLAVLTWAAPSAHGQTRPSAPTAQPQADEQSIAATRDVTVTVDVVTNSVSLVRVRGVAGGEVRVTSPQRRVELQRTGPPAADGKATGVRISDRHVATEREPRTPALVVEVSVPRGAAVRLRTHAAGVSVADVSAASVRTTQGDVLIERAAASIEANTLTGKVSVRDCRGQVRLRSVSGSVGAFNMTVTGPGDYFVANSISGNVNLAGVGHGRVEAGSVSGAITFDGALARGARFTAQTTSGDISLALPAESSFRVGVNLAFGSFNSDFPIKLTENYVSESSLSLTGTHGAGDAALSLASFSGTVRLRRKR